MIPVLCKQDYVIFTCTQPRLLRIVPFLHIPHVFSAYKEKYEKKKLAHKWIRSWVLDSPQFAAQTITDRFNELFGTDMEITYQCDVAIPPISDSNKNLINLTDGINDPYALIAPVSSRPERDIPIPVLNKVLDYLTEKKRMTCVILGDTERSGIMQNDRIRNLLGKTNLKEAIKLIEMSKMVFCTDSGPMHIAGALKKPTVALFTRDIASRWAPKTYCHPVSINMPCSPCRNETATACQHHECMKKIPLEMILQALDKVFAEC